MKIICKIKKEYKGNKLMHLLKMVPPHTHSNNTE